ncbi:uncharacterized protein BP5553_09680 [Venustampulla echinocandica]|uniref:NACHT domain-containing protein n=1 Tax=Venustampulla echinocandica TaxID=2656787 RepID=A0A370TBN8_9HELO|nr:uncharacterized protein BP5553_09680 [Venustampulla echinocandica]RDL31471.1 hypothetical protein BP5553_09680 [Venustampulla echinocandica]
MSIEELYPGKGENGNARPSIDIVAVHGLNPWNSSDHATATWEDPESRHLWLRDSLPLSQPNARILLYAYESSPAFGTDKERFVHQANSLLECLRLKRRGEPERPLIMMGHSLGGILIKQALVNAQNNPKYKSIKDATFAVVFFGTPHAGPSDDLKVKFAKSCVSVAQSMPWRVSNDIMEGLKRGSLFSDVLHENWRHQLEQYRFLSFYEGIGSIVPRESAVLHLGGDRENQVRLNADHSSMCRFNPSVKADMNNYFFVEENIADLCEQRPADTREVRNLLDKLVSIGSNPRQEKISDRHADSFQWIWDFSVDGPGFVDWLKSDMPIYWITGLPGSGKSTLMKYMYAESLKHLSSPTGQIKPAVMGYFFHELGESREQTFRSFLASFLSQIITSFEGLASLVLQLLRKPTNRQPGSLTSEDFEDNFALEEQHLQQALLAIAKHPTVSGNIIFFLDGLDECSGENRSQVQFLTKLVESSRNTKLAVRLCLASRSLPEIEPALESYPRCRIHEWTAEDISEYVITKLTGPWNLLEDYHLDRNLQEYDIRQSIIKKAGGVFLWVQIVVDNLIIGLEEGDTREELMERLESLPSDLEKLYARIVQQIPSKFIHDTINYINIVQSDYTPIDQDLLDDVCPDRYGSFTLLEFALATRDPKESLSQLMHHTEDAHCKFQAYCELVERRIKSRCRGLLYVRESQRKVRCSGLLYVQESQRKGRSDDPETRGYTSRTTRTGSWQFSGPLSRSMKNTVEFLHLTVQKYITSQGFMASIQAKTEHALTRPVSVGLMAAALTILKMLPPDQLFRTMKASEESRSQLCCFVRHRFKIQIGRNRFPNLAYGLLMEYFKLCRLAERNTGVSQSPFLKELDRICTLACKDWHSKLYEFCWNSNTNWHTSTRFSFTADLFSISIFMGLNMYVKEELESSRYKLLGQDGCLLLQFVSYIRRRIPNAPEALALLLTHGAQPNQEYDGISSWQYALDLELVHKGPRMSVAEYLMLATMLDFGADPNQRLSDGVSPLLKILQRIIFLRTARYLIFEGWEQCTEMKLVRSFIKNGIYVKPDMREILSEVKTCPELKAYLEKEFKQLEAAKPRKSVAIRKRTGEDLDLDSKQQKRRGKGT